MLSTGRMVCRAQSCSGWTLVLQQVQKKRCPRRNRQHHTYIHMHGSCALIKCTDCHVTQQQQHNNVAATSCWNQEYTKLPVTCSCRSLASLLWKPVYLSGMPPERVTYSTRQTCTLPLLLPLAMLWPSSHAVQHNTLPPAEHVYSQSVARLCIVCQLL